MVVGYRLVTWVRTKHNTHVSTRNNSLTSAQIEENRLIEDAHRKYFFRSLFGYYFQFLKNCINRWNWMFLQWNESLVEVLRKVFHFSAKYYENIFKNCMAIYNLHYFANTNVSRYFCMFPRPLKTDRHIVPAVHTVRHTKVRVFQYNMACNYGPLLCRIYQYICI